jgi:transcription-repair coupling factor (superfamily II helicase)
MSSLPNHTLTLRVEADWRKQPALLERLRVSADLGLRESAQHEWEAFLDPFSHNHAFPGMSLLHPLLNDTPPASLLDALPADGLLVFVDPDTIVSQVTDYARRLETQRTRLIHHGMLPAWYPDVVVGARRLAHAVPTLLLSETVPTQVANFVAVQPYHHHTVASAKPMTLGQRAADAATEPPVPFTHGQYVCHIDHGIAVFEGVVTQQIAGTLKPYLKLRYAGADRLYVPESQFDRVTGYGDPSNAAPQLTVLGTRDW